MKWKTEYCQKIKGACSSFFQKYINCPNITWCLPEKYCSPESGGGASAPPLPPSPTPMGPHNEVKQKAYEISWAHTSSAPAVESLTAVHMYNYKMAFHNIMNKNPHISVTLDHIKTEDLQLA